MGNANNNTGTSGNVAQEYISNRMRMEGLLRQARISLEHYLDPKIIPKEDRMSRDILRNAKGIVLITEAKGGFFVGIKGGSGIILVRHKNKWSPPCAVASGGISFGLLIGAAKIDHIIVLSTADEVNVFLSDGQLQLKGNFNATVGKWGRNIEGGGTAGCNAKISKIFTYSFGVTGIYSGISLDSEVLCVRKDCNEQFYNKHIDVKQILMGNTSVRIPQMNDDYKRIVEILTGFCGYDDGTNSGCNINVNIDDNFILKPIKYSNKNINMDTHFCICNEQLFIHKIQNNSQEITCDCCLQTMLTDDISYRCMTAYMDCDDPLHFGGFDICESCMKQLDYDSFINISDDETKKIVQIDPINDQIKQFKKAFSAVGIEGTISINQLGTIFPDALYQDIIEFVNKYDTNQDGILDFKEYAVFLKKAVLQLDDAENDGKKKNVSMLDRESLFNLFANNGFIEENGLAKAMNEIGITNVNIQQIIKQFDDDLNGRIDYNEFCEILNVFQHKNDKYDHKLSPDEFQKNLFQRFDEDGNEILDENELVILLSILGNEGYKYIDTNSLIKKYDKKSKGGVNFNEFKKLYKYLNSINHINKSNDSNIKIINDLPQSKAKQEWDEWILVDCELYDEKQQSCPIYEKVERFENQYKSKHIKLNVAVNRCVKRLLFDIQCYVAQEITDKKASQFDKIVDYKRKAKRWINSKVNWDNKKIKLVVELSLILSKIALNAMCPGAAAIIHFVEAGIKYDNGNETGAYLSIALGVACIVTAGLAQHFSNYGKVLWNGLQNIDIVADNLEIIITQIADLLQPVITEYLPELLSTLNVLHNNLGKFLVDIGMKSTSHLYGVIMRGVEEILSNASVTVNELIKVQTDNMLNVHLTAEIEEIFTRKVNDFIEDKFGKSYENLNDAFEDMKKSTADFIRDKSKEKVMNELKDKLRIFVLTQLSFIYNGEGMNQPRKGNNGTTQRRKTMINEVDILNDKHCILNDVGNFIKNIHWTFIGKNQLSEIKLFNKNGDSMIYIFIERSLTQFQKFYIKPQYELCAKVHCGVMFAGNETAKQQLLLQKLM